MHVKKNKEFVKIDTLIYLTIISIVLAILKVFI